MPSGPEERLDRRDFMIASVATIGASASLVVDARSEAKKGQVNVRLTVTRSNSLSFPPRSNRAGHSGEIKRPLEVLMV
jgi:hypothetical protein